MKRRFISSCNEVEPQRFDFLSSDQRYKKFLVKLFSKRLWVSEARAKPLTPQDEITLFIKYIELYFTQKIYRFISQFGIYSWWFVVCVQVDCRIVLKLSIRCVDKVYTWYCQLQQGNLLCRVYLGLQGLENINQEMYSDCKSIIKEKIKKRLINKETNINQIFME